MLECFWMVLFVLLSCFNYNQLLLQSTHIYWWGFYDSNLIGKNPPGVLSYVEMSEMCIIKSKLKALLCPTHVQVQMVTCYLNFVIICGLGFMCMCIYYCPHYYSCIFHISFSLSVPCYIHSTPCLVMFSYMLVKQFINVSWGLSVWK